MEHDLRQHFNTPGHPGHEPLNHLIAFLGAGCTLSNNLMPFELHCLYRDFLVNLVPVHWRIAVFSQHKNFERHKLRCEELGM